MERGIETRCRLFPRLRRIYAGPRLLWWRHVCDESRLVEALMFGDRNRDGECPRSEEDGLRLISTLREKCDVAPKGLKLRFIHHGSKTRHAACSR